MYVFTNLKFWNKNVFLVTISVGNNDAWTPCSLSSEFIRIVVQLNTSLKKRFSSVLIDMLHLMHLIFLLETGWYVLLLVHVCLHHIYLYQYSSQSTNPPVV